MNVFLLEDSVGILVGVDRLDTCTDGIWNSVSSLESDHNTKIICRKCLLLAKIVLVYGYRADYGSAVAVYVLVILYC